jgi:hypothetical protein
MDRYQQSSPGGGARLLAEDAAQVLEGDVDLADVERQLAVVERHYQNFTI